MSEEVHQPGCAGSDECGGTFDCTCCGRECGWCFGAADDLPDYCDDCWAEHHQGAE